MLVHKGEPGSLFQARLCAFYVDAVEGQACGETFAAMEVAVTGLGYPVVYSDKLSYSMIFYVKIG